MKKSLPRPETMAGSDLLGVLGQREPELAALVIIKQAIVHRSWDCWVSASAFPDGSYERDGIEILADRGLVRSQVFGRCFVHYQPTAEFIRRVTAKRKAIARG